MLVDNDVLAMEIEINNLQTDLGYEKDKSRYWELSFNEERDKHTARLLALTELREQVSQAIEDLQHGRDTAAVIDRLRRARVASRLN